MTHFMGTVFQLVGHPVCLALHVTVKTERCISLTAQFPGTVTRNQPLTNHISIKTTLRVTLIDFGARGFVKLIFCTLTLEPFSKLLSLPVFWVRLDPNAHMDFQSMNT